MFEPAASQIGLYQGFLRQIRKKVRKLLYHSLRTNVVAGEIFVRYTEEHCEGLFRQFGKEALLPAFFTTAW